MMHKVISRIGTVLVLFALFLCSSKAIDAQVGPTNTATVSGNVSDSSGKPVSGAQMTLAGPKHATTTTDAHGDFIFLGVPFGQYQLTASAQTLGTATRIFAVQGDTDIAIQYEPASMHGLKTIANVSTAAKASFNVTPASITQVNPISNAFDGKTSWRTILEQIPGIAQAGLTNGTYVRAAIPDSPFVPMQFSINGALPYETATLLDDMPVIGAGSPLSTAGGFAGGGTDLAYYPLNAFGSADVVRGPGASAPSIVDSIGGSFVLHAPGPVEQSHYEFSASTDPYGGIVANALVALRIKKLSIFATYGVNDSPGPTNQAIIYDGTSFATPATIDGKPFSPYLPPCPTCGFGQGLYAPNYNQNGAPLYGYESGLQICCAQTTTAWSQHSRSLTLRYAFSPSLTAEVFYVGQQEQDASIPIPTYYGNFIPPSGYTGAFPAGPFTLRANNVEATLSPGGAPTDDNASLVEESITAQLGAGTLRLAAIQNRTFFSCTTSGPTSAQVQLYGGGYLNGSSTVTIFNGDTHTATFNPFFSYSDSRADNRDLLASYTTPINNNLRAGASFVRSYYNMPGYLTYNYFGFGGSIVCAPPTDTEVTNELRVYASANPSEKTTLDLSMYFTSADYHMQNPNDPTGNTYLDQRYPYAAPRLGFVWRPTSTLSIRAAAGGGFAEAPLGYLIGTNGVPTCVSGSCSVTQVNVNLQPEKSFGFDIGADLRLRHDTIMSFDVYRSNLFGQFDKSTALTGTYLGFPLYTTRYNNLGQSRYEGVLADIRHEGPHGVFWSFSGGLTRGYVISVPAGFYNNASGACNLRTGTTPDGVVCPNITVVPGINFNGTFTGVSIPYSQALGVLGYRWSSDKSIDLTGTYYGNNNTYFRPAFVEFDGHVRYPVSQTTSLLLTFMNITGIYDGSTQYFSEPNIIGVPSIAGGPYPEFGEMYGPRTVTLTAQLRF